MEYTWHATNNMHLIGNGLEIDDLPATRTQYEDGTFAIVTYWKPSPEELALLNSNGLVKLHVLGYVSPPVAVCVGTP